MPAPSVSAGGPARFCSCFLHFSLLLSPFFSLHEYLFSLCGCVLTSGVSTLHGRRLANTGTGQGSPPACSCIRLLGSGSRSRPPKGLAACPHPEPRRLADVPCPDDAGPSASVPVQAGLGAVWVGAEGRWTPAPEPPLAVGPSPAPTGSLPSSGQIFALGPLDFPVAEVAFVRREFVSLQAWFSTHRRRNHDDESRVFWRNFHKG